MEQQEIQTKMDLYTQVFNDAKERVGDEAALVIVDQIGKHIRRRRGFISRRFCRINDIA